MLHPDILRTLRLTWTHLCTRTLVRPSPESTGARPEFVPLDPHLCVTILKRPEVRAVEEHINRLALAGDVVGTQRTCNAWNAAIKAAMKETL